MKKQIFISLVHDNTSFSPQNISITFLFREDNNNYNIKQIFQQLIQV